MIKLTFNVPQYIVHIAFWLNPEIFVVFPALKLDGLFPSTLVHKTAGCSTDARAPSILFKGHHSRCSPTFSHFYLKSVNQFGCMFWKCLICCAKKKIVYAFATDWAANLSTIVSLHTLYIPTSFIFASILSSVSLHSFIL